MTVAELIERLSRLDPDAVVAAGEAPNGLGEIWAWTGVDGDEITLVMINGESA